MILLFYFWHSIDSFFAGRMLGEVTSLVVSLVLAWRKLGSIRVVVSLSTLPGLALVALACVSVLAGWTGHLWAPSAVALAGYAGISAVWFFFLLRSIREAHLPRPQ